MNDAKARLLQLIADEPHMAEGGNHWSMGNPEQFVKNKSERIYPKKETMNRGVKEVKGVVDAFNSLIDQGVPVKDLVGGLVGAVPFVGPDLRNKMENATINLPAGFKRSPTNPQVATGINMVPAKVGDILGALKPSDFTGTKGMSNVLGDVGRGYAPNVLDVLDTLGMDITGFGGVGLGTALKGGRKAAGALSNLAKSEAGYKLAQKALQYVPAAQPFNVVKPTGGNWLGGRVEKELGRLKSLGVNGTDPVATLAELEKKYGKQGMEEVLAAGLHPMLKENAALNKWIDSNLGNYVKKQMATPDDPVRKLAEQGITHKASLPNEYQDALAPIEQRVSAGFPAEGVGQAPLARSWENASDEAVAAYNAGEIQNAPQKAERIKAAKQKVTQELEALNQQFENHVRSFGLKENEVQGLMKTMTPTEKAKMVGNDSFIKANLDYLEQGSPVTESQAKMMEENPWIAKVDPNSSVYSPHIGDLGFDHIVDVLNEDLANGRIRPEQLNKISMEQAVRRTHEFDQEMAKRMAAAQAKVTEGMPVHKEYPEGYKWIELTAPKATVPEGAVWEEFGGNQRLFGPKGESLSIGATKDEAIKLLNREEREKQLADALKYEGNTMGHCVGGYCPDVVSGRSRIFSLRDAKGEPHVTVETRPGAYTPFDIPEDIRPIYQQHMTEGTKTHGGRPGAAEWMQHFYPERFVAPPEEIKQIKGKQNRAPKEEYLPYVQDFVKSGNWSDVGDLRNTGLRKVEGQYMTEPEHDDWLLNQLQPPEEGMAEGGEVKSFFDEKSAKQRVLDLLNHEPHMDNGVMAVQLPLQLQGEIANDAFGGIGGGGRATYTHPIGKDAAVRAYIEGGGYKPKDMDYKGQVNNIGISYEKAFNDGGEAHMAGGGLLKAIEAAQQIQKAKKATMYSAVDKALEASKRGAGTGMEFANELAKTSGIKKAELIDRGIMVPSKNGPVLNPALTQLPKMSKQEFVSHLNEKYKPPGVRKITLDAPKSTHEMIDKKAIEMMADDAGNYADRHGDSDYHDVFNSYYDNDYNKYYERAKAELEEEGAAKYSKYKMPGAENYRENLYQYEEPKGKAFLESHWDDPNILYHMRQTDRTTPAGKALHIEEIQSDWHQKGRDKGYANPFAETQYVQYLDDLQQRVKQNIREDYIAEGVAPEKAEQLAQSMANRMAEDPRKLANYLDEEEKRVALHTERLKAREGIPDAPLKKNWHEHALKQALMDAAEGGYDQLLVTPGAEQAKRYDLSKQISKVKYFDEPNSESGLLHAYDLEGNNVLSERIPKDKIQDYIGKDAAKKLLSQEMTENERTGFPSQQRTLSGLDLQVGGEGMAGFYDKMVPSYLNDLGKKYGVRVGEHAIENEVPHSKTIPTMADVQRLAQELYGLDETQAISSLPLEQRRAINKAFADRVKAENATKLHSFDITPEMREDILTNGLPMYQRGGEVHMGRGGWLNAIETAQKINKAAKVEHPLVFPRAAAKTIEDIRPIAQRMAEQMTGEFVRQNPKVTTNPAGKSRKQFERERSIPLETRNLVPEREAPAINYEDYMGHAIVGVPGDPTLGGVAKRGSLEEVAQPTVELTRVGDITPDYPVPLFGGPRYGDEDKFWASNFGAAVPIQKNASKLADKYQSPVLAKYIKMGSGSENFALHNLDALLSIQRPERLDKAKMAQLTEAIQAGSPKYGKFPGFTGFKDPADVLLQAQMDSNLRKHIAETLTKPTITDQLGLPNGLDVVAAITHPELRNLETGASGFSVGKMKPGAELQRGQSSHPTYDTDIPGSFLGRSKYPTPYEIAFPDTTAYARSQMTPGVQEFNMMKMLGPRERIDQQYIDEIKMYEQLMKQYTGKKKGGLAHTKKVKRHGNTVSN